MAKRKFYVYQEDLIRYKIVQETVTISQLVEDLNKKYSQDDMQKLRTETITNYLKETNINYSDWKKRKSVWYSLKDKNEYSAEMVAKVLCYNAGGKDMSKPTKKEIKNMSALYNASTVKKGASYGKKIYKYNKLYVKYNKWN